MTASASPIGVGSGRIGAPYRPTSPEKTRRLERFASSRSGLLFRESPGVREQNLQEIGRRLRRIDPPVTSFSEESGEIAGVVNVPVSQDHRVDRPRVDRK